MDRNIIMGLQNKDNTKAYELLLEMEKQSAENDGLYVYFDDYIKLLDHKSSFVRTRGFRMACAQAPWDKEEKLEANFDKLLKMMDDPKPIALRQCLRALHIVVLYKPRLMDQIQEKIKTMN